MNDPSWLESSIAMMAEILDNWFGKLSIGAVMTSVCKALHLDADLVMVCFCMLSADMILRVFVAAKQNAPMCPELKRAIPRYIFYMMFIVLAWSVEFTIAKIVTLDVPFVNLMIAYLILTDCASVTTHLVHLGVPVPKFIRMAILGGQKRIEQATQKCLNLETEDLKDLNSKRETDYDS